MQSQAGWSGKSRGPISKLGAQESSCGTPIFPSICKFGRSDSQPTRKQQLVSGVLHGDSKYQEAETEQLGCQGRRWAVADEMKTGCCQSRH